MHSKQRGEITLRKISLWILFNMEKWKNVNQEAIVAKASDGQRYPCPARVVCD